MQAYLLYVSLSDANKGYLLTYRLTYLLRIL